MNFEQVESFVYSSITPRKTKNEIAKIDRWIMLARENIPSCTPNFKEYKFA